MILFFSFLFFSGALMAAAWYVYSVPRQAESRLLIARLREIRAKSGGPARASRGVSDLMIQEQKGTFSYFNRVLDWIGPARRLQLSIEQANLTYRATDVLTISVLMAGLVYLLLGLFGGIFLLRLLVAIAFGSLPIAYIMRVRGRRLAKFEENLPDAIDLFNRSMRAGHNIQSGLETLGAETVEPVKMEFRRVVEELALGSQLETALHNLGTRVPLIDLKFFIIGLILQRQTGANMVAVLENLSVLIRERLNMAAKMKAATTQQRFSAGLLCVLPIVVGLGFWVVKPEYIMLLFTDETGTKFLTYAIISEIIGVLLIRQISNPKL